MLCTRINAARTGLAFNQSVPAVAQMLNTIRLLAVSAVITGNFPAKRGAVNFQTPDAERPEQKPKRPEIGLKISGQNPRRCNSKGRIDQVSFCRRTNRGFGTDCGTPRRYVIDNMAFCNGSNIFSDRFIGNVACDRHIAVNCFIIGRSADIPGVRTQNPLRPFGIPPDSVGIGNIRPASLSKQIPAVSSESPSSLPGCPPATRPAYPAKMRSSFVISEMQPSKTPRSRNNAAKEPEPPDSSLS